MSLNRTIMKSKPVTKRPPTPPAAMLQKARVYEDFPHPDTYSSEEYVEAFRSSKLEWKGCREENGTIMSALQK